MIDMRRRSQLVKHSNGKVELRGGSVEDQRAAREWADKFLPMSWRPCPVHWIGVISKSWLTKQRRDGTIRSSALSHAVRSRRLRAKNQRQHRYPGRVNFRKLAAVNHEPIDRNTHKLRSRGFAPVPTDIRQVIERFTAAGVRERDLVTRVNNCSEDGKWSSIDDYSKRE